MGFGRLPVHAVPVGILPAADEPRWHQTRRFSQGGRRQAAPEQLHVPASHKVHTRHEDRSVLRALEPAVEHQRGAVVDQDQQGDGEDVQGQGAGQVSRRAALQVRQHVFH